MSILATRTNGSVLQLTLNDFPNTDGTPAPVGSMAFVMKNGMGSSWVKIGPGDKDWKNDNDDDFKSCTFLFEDWQTGAIAGQSGFVASNSNGGASNTTTLAPTGSNCGILTLRSGGGANAYAFVATHATNQGNLILSGKTVIFETLVHTSDFTNGKAVNIGLGRSISAAEQTYGVYFRFKRSESLNWICKTSNNNTRSTVISNVPVVTGTWVSLKFISDGTTIKYFINNVLVATISTNLPTLPVHRFANTLVDAAGESGATNFSIDYMALTILFITPRN